LTLKAKPGLPPPPRTITVPWRENMREVQTAHDVFYAALNRIVRSDGSQMPDTWWHDDEVTTLLLIRWAAGPLDGNPSRPRGTSSPRRSLKEMSTSRT
jgi:hypothetical protein